ncbi:MAG: MmgE/PrpD family protein, partial [Proteobacteria bacterium]|nr:MmgE/PrpD family protein [Pseudomonadota bacterium]
MSGTDIKHFTPDIFSDRGAGLTREVAEFAVETDYSSIPDEVAGLANKSILDGLGLA